MFSPLAFLPALLLAAAFVLGGIPTGLLLAQRKGVDLRTVGSGNIGASNVGRTLGRAQGLLVLLVDASKGAVPVLVARAFGLSSWWQAAAGLCAVFGHVFSVFLRGKGGKGVATALGASLALAPLAAAASFGVYLLLYLPFRLSSVGSLGGTLAFPIFLFVIGPRDPAIISYACATFVLIVYRHRDNLRRLRQGKELRA